MNWSVLGQCLDEWSGCIYYQRYTEVLTYRQHRHKYGHQ